MKRLNDKEFVTAWMTTPGSVVDLAKHLGVANPSSLSTRANALRSKGVKLPKKLRNSEAFTVEELNEIVDKYTVIRAVQPVVKETKKKGWR